MKDDAKIKTTYTKDMLIKRISSACVESPKVVRDVYNALEEDVAKLLSCADESMDISIRLFEGITLGSTFIPEKEKLNNLTGETIMTLEKIKPKAHITRNYCEKITNYNK